MPKAPTREYTEFQGRRYFLDPDGYWKTSTSRGRRQRLLHRDVWEHHHGRPIPDGWHVHHRNEDKSDNSPGNLKAMTPAEHQRHHAQDGRGFASLTTEQRSVMARASWAAKQPTERTCQNCGDTFMSTGQRAKYCRAQCRVAHNRERIQELARARYSPEARRASYDRTKL